jgi:thiamine monophosphate synthase
VEGWLVLTKDSKIRYRSNETEVLLAAKVRAFVLVSSNLPGSEMAAVFVRALPSIKRLCAKQSAPFIAHVHRSGDVALKQSRR